MKESLNEELGKRNNIVKRKDWMTNEILYKIDERREWKNADNEEGRKMYKKLKNEIRRERHNRLRKNG